MYWRLRSRILLEATNETTHPDQRKTCIHHNRHQDHLHGHHHLIIIIIIIIIIIRIIGSSDTATVATTNGNTYYCDDGTVSLQYNVSADLWPDSYLIFLHNRCSNGQPATKERGQQLMNTTAKAGNTKDAKNMDLLV